VIRKSRSIWSSGLIGSIGPESCMGNKYSRWRSPAILTAMWIFEFRTSGVTMGAASYLTCGYSQANSNQLGSHGAWADTAHG
jgi:hypothetical protein